MTSHLIIPDPHAHPDYSNHRFDYLGRLVSDLRPDHVICIGDWADMPSLSSYDRGTKGYEGRRYHLDVSAAIQAQDLFFAPIKAKKKKLPTFWMLRGNHEYRIDRAINSDPAHLDGVISPRDLQYEDYGWNVVQYDGSTPGVLKLDGIAYSHYFTSGVMGRPIGGEHPAYQLLTKQYLSCTQGHIHTTDYCVRTNAFDKYIQALVCGCYIDYNADWAGNANHMWWRGVVYKENVDGGNYDPRWISLPRVEGAYRA